MGPRSRLLARAAAAAGLSIALLAVADGTPARWSATVGHSAGLTSREVQTPPAAPVTTATAAPSTPAAPTPPNLRSGPRVPLRLLIPRIGVDAPVEQVGVDRSGRMGVPARSADVGWYWPGPAPGEPGDAVIDGHLDWYDTPRAVFYDLGALRPGDEVDVTTTGVHPRFVVTATQTVPYTADPPGLFDATGEPRLSLITCAGRWDGGRGTYSQRLIVTARSLAP